MNPLPGDRPGLLIRGARLVPVGPAPVADGLVDVRVEAGRVAAVAPVLRPGGGDTVLDAAGRWLIPGLWDQHVHMTQWAQTRTRLDVGGTAGPEAVTRIVGEHVAGLPPGAAGRLVAGYGFRSATWARQPTVAELDAVSGDHPVVLTSGDAHNGWLNSRALALLGVAPRTGVLTEIEWFALMPAAVELAAAADTEGGALRRAVGDVSRRGVVGIVDFELEPGFRHWPERFARGIDSLRVRPAVYPPDLAEAVENGLRTGRPLAGTAGLCTMGSLKIISDGSLNTRTAHCHEPYAGAPAGEHAHGQQNYDRAELIGLLGRATASGLHAAVHAIGDAAVGIALDAFAATGATGSIEHAQLITRADVERMGRLGITASVQPAHLLDDRDVTQACWPDRSDRCFAFATMVGAGVRLALGSDAPVSPLDPWLAMAAAVHRSADRRSAWNPAEALRPAQALAASTDGQTTVAPGAPGDLVLLDDDPLRPEPDTSAAAARLRGMRVAATVVAGRVVHLEIDGADPDGADVRGSG